MSLRWRRLLAVALLGAGLLLAASGGWIHAKAQLAQWLMQGAWQATVAGFGPVRPWPWADGHPVGRIRAQDGAVDLLVLSDSSGRNLAFAPGHVAGSALPGGDGYTVIGGHRDTHFAFLAGLAAGDRLEVQGQDGQWRVYRVAGSEVADIRRDRLPLAGPSGTLLLVTCWPFGAVLPGGPLRYLVEAREMT